ncbi:response regulator, partial [Escherichia coli]|nr:response regulator [Escherichia coli]
MTDRILLVEDDPGSRDLIGALLAARGDAFDCAADGFLGLR